MVEKRGKSYRISFRFGGRHFSRSLKTSEESKAETTRLRVEETLSDLERGRLQLPPDSDLVTFLLSDGKVVQRPKQVVRDDLRQMADALNRARAGVFWLPRLIRAVAPLIGPSWRGIKRPDLVLFGDAMAQPAWTWAQQDVELCDVLVMVGTSGLVYPAALLPSTARQRGATVISVDPEEGDPAHIWLRGRQRDPASARRGSIRDGPQ